VRRADDEPEAIRNRLAVYRRQTAPVLDWYRQHGTRIATVDAVGAPDDVTKRALGALGL
jgi:adenylate kinase